MDLKPFISVVIPVYNAEKHINNAVNSIKDQTFKNFEIILVDDGSNDNSGYICDELSKSNAYITSIHHEKNKGLSITRNTGMESASGRYIFFMDADDRIDNNLFECFNAAVKKNAAQVTVFGLIEDYYDQNGKLCYSTKISHPEIYLSDKKSIRQEVIKLEQMTLYGYAWNKIYDLDYLKSKRLRFTDIKLIEDVKFNVDVFMDIDSLNILGITPYHYDKRIDSSLTSKFYKDYFYLNSSRVSMILNQYKKWDICDAEVLKILANVYVRYIISALQRNCDKRSKMKANDRRIWLLELYQNDLYKSLIMYADPESRIVKILSDLLKKKRIGFCLICGRLIYIIKNKLPILFAKAKQNR